MDAVPSKSIDVHGTDVEERHAAMADLVMNNSTDGTAFFLTDLGDVYRKFVAWQQQLPSIEPFYAVKCNGDHMILRLLAALGVNFDCASMAEIEAVLNLGVTPDRIIFANPCKAITHLQYARKVGVRMMTFDNEFELSKIAQHYPEAALVLRILVDDSKSRCRLGLKFGADMDSVAGLLSAAKYLGLDVIGVSFHAGSGASDATTYGDAIRRVKTVFEQAAAIGFDLELVDVGGGFPGHAIGDGGVRFEDIATELTRALSEYFPGFDNKFVTDGEHNNNQPQQRRVRVIAEPGRYFVASASSLGTCITSKRRIVVPSDIDGTETSSYMYYINDGVYGSFNCILFDHAEVHAKVLYTSTGVPSTCIKHEENRPAEDVDVVDTSGQQMYPASLWGPTCDSMDCVQKQVMLPELSVGDWLVFDNMGAYTSCAASTFNGFALSQHVYTFTRKAGCVSEAVVVPIISSVPARVVPTISS
eukprot:gene508-3834_t